MRSNAIQFLTNDLGKENYRLVVFEEEGEVIEGVLEGRDGYWYPITRGVPCFLRGPLRPNFGDFQRKHGLPVISEKSGCDNVEDQLLTNVTFSDKWRRFRRYGLEPDHQVFLFNWYCKKLGFSTVHELRDFYRNMAFILEVGPGSGFKTKFMAESTDGQVFGVDISDAAFTAYENTKHLDNCHIFQGDLMDLPFRDGFFDFILADGVLHHTPDTKKGLIAIYKKLRAGGWLFFYVYKKMGPLRQFCDQLLRDRFSKLDPEACYTACEALTDLGRELSRLNAKVTLEKPIPLLGIPSGTHDVQRLLYYNFVKCFWNEAFDYETNNMVNFDWYHPHSAWQHTEEEVRGWLDELGVKEYNFHDANPNGISVLLRRS